MSVKYSNATALAMVFAQLKYESGDRPFSARHIGGGIYELHTARDSYRVAVTDDPELIQCLPEDVVVGDNGIRQVDFGTAKVATVFGVPTAITSQVPRLSLGSLVRFADVLPLDLRKRVKAMAGDYDAEVAQLCADGRYRTARWNRALAWGCVIVYVFRGPLDWALGLLIKSFKGH